MKYLMKKRKSTGLRYKQIFFLFFTFFIVFTLVSSVIYASMVNSQKERLKRQVEQSLSVDVNLMDQYIQRVHNAAYNFLSKISVYYGIPPQGKYTPGDYQNISLLVDQMGEFYSSVSDYAYQTYFFSNDQHVITPNGTYEFDSYFDKIFQHENYTADYWRNREPEEDTFTIFPVDTVKNTSVLSVFNVIPLVVTWEKQQQPMTLVIEINSLYVRNMMAGNLTLDGQFVVCSDQWGNTLVNTMNEEIPAQDMRQLNNRVVKSDAPVMLDNVPINGTNYYACGMRDMNGAVYYILTPSAVLSHAAYQTNQYLLGIFLGTMVMFFVLTLFFSNKLFHPIRDILDSMELLKKDNVIAVNNWRLAESSLHEQQALTEQYVNSAVALVRDSISEASISQIEPYFFQATGLAKENLICAVLKFSFQESYAEEFNASERQAIEEALPQVLQAMLNSRFQSYFAKYDPNCFVCFLNGGPDTKRELQEVLKNLRDVFRFDLHYCRISCGISEAVSQERGGFAITVLEAFSAAAQSSLNRGLGNFSVIDFEADKVQYRPVLVQNDLSRLYNLMRAGEKDELYTAVDEILKANIMQNVHYNTMKLVFARLYSVAADYLLACGLDPKMAAEEYWDQIMPADCSKNPEEAIKHFLGHCVDITHSDVPQDGNISSILSFITNHYSEDIYLDLIAQRMNMNPKYLSRVFKSKVGITITEHISMVRISKAKELLVKTNMRIEDIGTAVGFENRTTFFRLFKKMEGMPPNRYRKENTL